jgi:hypothetical protein
MDSRFLRAISVLAMAAGFLIGIAGPALATTQDQLQEFRDELAGFEAAMQDARAVLEAKEQAQWSDAEISDYLYNALWVAFDGNLIHLLESKSQATTADFQIVSAARAWPGNPFNNWEPMKVLSLDEPFSAGDLVFQLCSSDYASVSGDQIIYSSFELAVYGADVNSPASVATECHPRNAAWARTPQGACYSLGYWREPASRTYEKRRAREELRRRYHEEQEAGK